MSVHFERRTVEEAYIHYSRLGRVYCSECAGKHDIEQVNEAGRFDVEPEYRCDNCGRLCYDVKTYVEKEVAIEYVNCRIF